MRKKDKIAHSNLQVLFLSFLPIIELSKEYLFSISMLILKMLSKLLKTSFVQSKLDSIILDISTISQFMSTFSIKTIVCPFAS